MHLATTLNRLLPAALQPVPWLVRRYLRWSGLVIQGGPFRGMQYIAEAHCSALAPKIAGSYERELHPYLARLFAGEPDVFLDVGAAEGYYAVGAAYAGWHQHVIAYEAVPEARRAFAELLACNPHPGVEIELHGPCTPDGLEAALQPYQRPAVLMDVEGYEAFLLDPVRVPSLARCRLLVEQHDFVLPGLAEIIIERLRHTHAVERIGLQPRTADELPCTHPLLRRLPGWLRRRVLDEKRPFSQHGWLWFEPRSVPPA